MKSILLATASILAFAGAAAAEVTFGGNAKLGYNIDNGDEPRDDDAIEGGEGFFWEANLGVALSQELNNGLTAAASFSLNISDNDDGGDVDVDNDFLLSLTAQDAGGLFLGDTAFAAESHWDSAGSMQADDFSEADGEVVLRGDIIYGGVEASVSGIVADDDNNRPNEDLDQLSVGAEATVSRFTMSMGYQEESEILEPGYVHRFGYNPESNDDFDASEVFGISAGTTFGGADVQVAYAKNFTFEDSSLGFEVAYPFGPVTLGAYYVLEEDDASGRPGDAGNDDLENSFGVSADYASGPLTVSAFYEFDDDGDTIDTARDDQDEDDDYGLEVGYDMGTGLEVYAGFIDETGNYVGAEYDLGNGAEMIVSYADQDEEGAREYEAGTTVQVKFEF